MTKYSNLGQYIYNITAQINPAVADVVVEWWWTDPDEPQSDAAWDESVPWESDTDANDNHADDDAWIVGSPNVPESYPGPVPPAEYHYRTTQTNSQGMTTITFRVSTYGGDNYQIHARRTDTSEEDTSPIITVKRKATLYKSSMRSSTGTPGYYLPDHSLVQASYNPAYIDFFYEDHNLNVAYQYTILSGDANALYNYCNNIKDPGDHELTDVGINRFDNNNILGVALSWLGGDPAQHSILAVGRIKQLPGNDIDDVNGVFIHELGHLFGLDHSTGGVMTALYGGERKFMRYQITYMREDPAWD